MKHLLFTTLLLVPALLPAKEHATSASFAQATPSIFFTENKGQITDQHLHCRTDIQYKVAASGINLYIGNGKLHYQFYDEGKGKREKLKDSKKESVHMYRMDVTLIGANRRATVVAGSEAGGYEHYHTTALHDVTVHSYSSITYQNIYPHIDWVLYSKDGHLEYDFVVHPGGNVKDIRIKYSGATNLQQNADGNIAAITPMGTISEQQPITYQQENGQKIASAAVLRGHTLHFTTGPCNGTLVIDPTLDWSTYYYNITGNNNYVYSSIDYLPYDSIAPVHLTTRKNSIYISGVTNLSANIATIGAWQTTLNGISDIYLSEFDTAGQRVWTTYFGGSGFENVSALTSDDNGDIYMTGLTGSTNITTPGAYQTYLADTFYGASYVSKFDTGGSLQWCTYVGIISGVPHEQVFNIACDHSNGVYIIGTGSYYNFSTPGVFGTTPLSLPEGIVTKFDANGQRVWSSYVDSTEAINPDGYFYKHPLAIACDMNNNVYVAGDTRDTMGMSTPGAWQTAGGGLLAPQNNGFLETDIFFIKFSNNGQRLWCTYYGGSGIDVANSLVCDANNNVYMAGFTTSPNNITSAGSYRSILANDTEAFLTCFNSGGQRQWGTYYGTSYTNVQHMTVDANNNLWMTGDTRGNISPTADAWQHAIGGGNDAFFAEFSNTGNYLYGTYFGGNGDETGSDIALVNKKIFICGNTSSTTGIATPGSFQTTDTLPISSFLACFKYNPQFFIPPDNDTLLCAGGHIEVPFRYISGFQLPCTFTAQLSDTAGSFNNAATIGTLVANVSVDSDSVSCVIPFNIPNGHYKIRILSNNPVDTTSDTLTVAVTAVPLLQATANTPVCAGDTLKLSSGTTPLGAYQWTGPDGFSSTQPSPAIANSNIVNNSGTYKVTNMNGCGTLTDSVAVTVNPSTPVNMYIGVTPSLFIAGETVTFTAYLDVSVAGLAFQWYVNGNPVGNATTSSFISTTLNMGDQVYVKVKSADGHCITPDSLVSNIISLAVPNVHTADGLSIYPNPASGAFTLQSLTADKLSTRSSITITNMLGQVVYAGMVPVVNGSVHQQYDLVLPTGFYDVRVGAQVLKMEIIN